jgi:hypothetical protein
MNEWLYRAIMAALAVNILFGVYVVITHISQPKLCLNGIVMVLNKDRDMYVQSGTLPTHCMPISRD